MTQRLSDKSEENELEREVRSFNQDPCSHEFTPEGINCAEEWNRVAERVIYIRTQINTVRKRSGKISTCTMCTDRFVSQTTILIYCRTMKFAIKWKRTGRERKAAAKLQLRFQFLHRNYPIMRIKLPTV